MEDLLKFFSILSPCLGIGLGLIIYKRLSLPARIITLLLGVSITCDVIMYWMAESGVNNLWVAHIYGFIEALLLSVFFASLILKRRYIIGVSLLYLTFYVLNSIFLEPIETFNANARALEAVMMISFCFLFFYHIYQMEADIFIERSPDFWIVIGVVIYFSGAFFSFLLATDILSDSYRNFYGSWILHNLSNTLKNLAFAFALWQIHKHQRRITSA